MQIGAHLKHSFRTLTNTLVTSIERGSDMGLPSDATYYVQLSDVPLPDTAQFTVYHIPRHPWIAGLIRVPPSATAEMKQGLSMIPLISGWEQRLLQPPTTFDDFGNPAVPCDCFVCTGWRKTVRVNKED